MWDTADTSAQSSSSSSSAAAAAAAAAAAVSYYRVFYYNMNELSSIESDVTVEQRSALITELCAFCEYNVRVVAYSVNGASLSSDNVTARTLSDGQSSFSSRQLH